MDEILTAEQVAQILQVHPFTVLKFIKKGKLKASKLGRVYRIRRSDVDKFLDNQIEQVEPESKTTTTRRKRAQKKEKKVKSEEKITEVKEIPDEIVQESKPESEPVIVIEEVKPEEVNSRQNTSDIDHYVIELKNK